MDALRRRTPLLLAVLGGCTFALTAPPTDLYPAVIAGLALLAAAIHDAPTTWRAFGRGAAWGTAAGLVGLRFVPAVIQRFTSLGIPASLLALALLAAAQSLVWAMGAAVASALIRRARAPLELAFSTGVFLAVSLPTIFAWTPAGLVSPWPVLLQLADFLGERGVSAIFAVGAALLARAGLVAAGRAVSPAPVPAAAPVPVLETPAEPPERARNPRLLRAAYPALGAAVLFAALAAHGTLRMASLERAGTALPTVHIALVNHAVGPHERWEVKNHPQILRRLRDLTREAEAAGAELTVWPEAAYPYPIEHSVRHAPRGPKGIVGGGVRGPLVLGVITRAPPITISPGVVETNSYNSATVVLPDGSMQPTQDKLQLLWFGEMVPGGAYLPWLRRIFQKSGGLIPGDEPRALTLELGATGRDKRALRPEPHDGSERPILRMGVLNCYEDTLTAVGRRIAGALEPNLLVNVTNDAWFTGSAEPELHARLAAMRAIELRRDLVRAVNLGVASWIDARGVVRARDEHATPGALHVTPAIRADPPTFYTRFGDTPLAVLLAMVTLTLAARSRSARARGSLSP